MGSAGHFHSSEWAPSWSPVSTPYNTSMGMRGTASAGIGQSFLILALHFQDPFHLMKSKHRAPYLALYAAVCWATPLHFAFLCCDLILMWQKAGKKTVVLAYISTHFPFNCGTAIATIKKKHTSHRHSIILFDLF